MRGGHELELPNHTKKSSNYANTSQAVGETPLLFHGAVFA